MVIAFSIEECAWLDVYATSRGSAPRAFEAKFVTRSRAASSTQSAALDALAERVDVPLALAGYSFGAAVALATDDDRVTAIATVAPPLAMMSVNPPSVPTLVLTPQHDQFSPPDATRPIVGEWDDCDFDTVESADHFLIGHTYDVGRRVTAWLVGRY